MSYKSPYNTFIFEGYSFDLETFTAEFRYSFDGTRSFVETVIFSKEDSEKFQKMHKKATFENALKLSFYVAGTSYYKAFPTKQVVFKQGVPDAQQAEFLNQVYTKGLSQFIFENDLTTDNIATFKGSEMSSDVDESYEGKNILALQSGGKDSLLLATLLERNNKLYNPVYMSSSGSYPKLLGKLSKRPRLIKRQIDSKALYSAATDGALNGHVPVTYIVESYSLIDAVIHGEDRVLASIGTEGNEAHEHVGELAINHQWSKTWEAEQLLANYVHSYIATSIDIGSPLRAFSELKIAELFVSYCWQKFGNSFSSCNIANYQQGADNTKLQWCGNCSKCANSFLLFAPFVEPEELKQLFGGQDLFKKLSLQKTFKGLLGVEGVMKPFECVGEVGELRQAYHLSRTNFPGVYELPFVVPKSRFDYNALNDIQDWAKKLLTTVYS